MPTTTVRVQEKGQVTIPLEIRKKLNLKKGDFVTFIPTDKGIVVQPVEVLITAALDKVGEELAERGVSLEQLIERGRDIRGELLKEVYGLTDSQSR